MIRLVAVGIVALTTMGCLGGKGPAPDAEEPLEPEAEPECPTNGGVLEGAVYYWGLPGEPDSIPADSVDVFLNNGGPTYRTPTSIAGTFSIDIVEGPWSVGADDQTTGCLNENSRMITVTRCETTTVELVIDYCEY